MADAARLATPLADGDLRLDPLAEAHREPLRAACAEDRDIWEIYPVSMIREHFDPAFDGRFGPPFISFAVLWQEEVVGTTGYLRPEPDKALVEIGGTYIAPRMRGTGMNGRMKRLLIDHASACGFDRIRFNVDERNLRSQAAVRKLGARQVELRLAERVTWTGFVRNTVVFELAREGRE